MSKVTPSQKLSHFVTEKGGKILSSYISALRPVEVECSKNHKWSAKPKTILEDWCQECIKTNVNLIIEILEDLEVDMIPGFVVPELPGTYFDAMVSIGEEQILYCYDTNLFIPANQHRIISEIKSVEKLGYKQVRIEYKETTTKDELSEFLENSLTDPSKLILKETEAYSFYTIGEETSVSFKKASTIVYIPIVGDISKKKAVLLYGRVSTAMQLEGFSLESQRMEAERYVAFIEGYLKAVYQDEGISGRKFTEREALQQLLGDVQNGDIVFVKSLSRLSRKLKDILYLKEILESKGASIYVSDFNLDTKTSIGTLVFHVLASFCQFESDQLGDRVRQDKSGVGGLPARPKFGWKKGLKKGDLPLKDEEEQEIIQFIRQTKITSPKTSLRAMSQLLQDKKYTCRKCRQWYPSRLRTIMIDNKIPTCNKE